MAEMAGRPVYYDEWHTQLTSFNRSGLAVTYIDYYVQGYLLGTAVNYSITRT